MDGPKPDALTDDALDRELTAAFAVDHSLEFAARVRTRIAAEPAPRSPWVPFAVFAACAAPVVLALVVAGPAMWTRGAEPAASPARTADVALAAVPITPLPTVAPHVEATPAHIGRAASRIADAPAGARPVEAPAPEVLISREEQHAFQLFQMILRDGTLDSDAFVETEQPATPQLQALVTAPITIEPLNYVSQSE